MTFKGQRAMALMHLAMHDTLNAIDRRYEPYAYTGPDADAGPEAAAAQAAHDVLVALYPNERARLKTELAKWASKPVSVGRKAARAILSAREKDGWDLPGTYEFKNEPGLYQTTPDWDGFMLQPGFRLARPLALKSSDQFRPPPPPPLTSERNQRDLREVRDASGAGGFAIWWMEFSEGSATRLARQLVTERQTDLWDAARMFALLMTSLYDTYIAVWDSKYEYNHWRPYTAIRATIDPNWNSLLPAPPFPEYVSAHAGGCAAAFAILEKTFGSNVSFTMKTLTAPPEMPERSFTSFDAAADECAESRIRLGWHFLYATDAGLELGRRVADYVSGHYLK